MSDKKRLSMNTRQPRRALISLALAVALSPFRGAGLEPNALFSDRAVLQQDAVLPIWGRAAPGTEVNVRLAGQTASAETGEDGTWQVRLDPVSSPGPHTLVMSGGGQTIAAEDVLVGEVWLASGQSNMAWPVIRSSGGEAAAARAQYPGLRFFKVNVQIAVEPKDRLLGEWVKISPENVRPLSAVAFYFAEALHADLDRPIGVILSAIGGSPAEMWTPYETLQVLPGLDKTRKYWADLLDTYPALKRNPDAVLATWRRAYREFRDLSGAHGRGEIAERPVLRVPNPYRDIPGGCYHGMIHPLAPYALRGVIWYQGEANSSNPIRARRYATLFDAMIQSWRARWQQPDLPFLFVQLPEFERNEGWWWLRDSQRRVALQDERAAMFVSIKTGDLKDIHPPRKEPVGRGLANMALRMIYDRPGPVMGPLASEMCLSGDTAVVRFVHAEGGLVRRGERLSGFEIAGADGRFVPADARIEGSTVIVSADAVRPPAAVRYGFSDAPRLTLYNNAGLPASPFYEGRVFDQNGSDSATP
jgi:sialate O-acetylesterase